MANVTKRKQARVFIIPQRAGPANAPQYMSWTAAGAVAWPQGDVSQIEVPSDIDRNSWDVIDETQAAQERATLSIDVVDKLTASSILKWVRDRCPMDVLVLEGQCSDPRDFDGGWSTGKVRVLESAYPTDYGTSELSAMTSGDDDKVTQTVPFSARDYYEVAPMSYAERAATDVNASIVAILVCDTAGCGDCADPSDGCQKVYAIMAPAGSSPGVLPEVIFSDDGFTTSSQGAITTLGVGDDPNDAACVGDNLVVVSEDSESLHYADKEEILDAEETWTEVTTGFVAGNGPLAITSNDPRNTWISAENGYIYYTDDPTSGVEVQDAGAATTENLNDIECFSTTLVVAVGDNNAVVVTYNGGETWAALTGPAAGVNLLSVSIRKEKEWWIGTAGGQLFYTVDQGDHWTEKTFPGSGTGEVRAHVWASDTVGFMTHKTAATAGRILRTISGGNSWFVVPEGAGSIPANDQLNALAVCVKDVNTLYAGGLADNAADGIIIKGSTTY